jgi:hypothetical protein
MRGALLVLTVLAAFGASRSAAADACGDAFDQSQVKRLDGKLMEARTLFRVCSASSCSPTQQKLCSEWVTDAEARVPSFLLSARDSSGARLTDVRVLMDGAPVKTKLDGLPVEADPGRHVLVFVLPDGTKSEVAAVAEERQKGKAVSVTFATAPVTPAPIPPPPASSATPKLPLRTVGVVTGAVGVVGVALGAVFGGLAIATRGSDCPGGACQSASDRSTAYTQGTVSTVGFVAGGALLAGGLTLFLVAPKSTEAHSSVSVSPMMGPSTGGLQLGGTW